MIRRRWICRTGGVVPGARFRSVVLCVLLLLPMPRSGGDRARASDTTGPEPLTSRPAWTAEIDQAAAFFGAAVASAGDINGDGYADVIVGAYLYDNDQGNEGKACVYTGSAAGLSKAPTWTAEGDQDNAYLGVTVDGAGDVNGDGFDDVIVGLERIDIVQINDGQAVVYLGSAGGLAALPAWSAHGDQEEEFFGVHVGGAGDVNGDGFDDVIVGAHFFTGSFLREGRAFVFHGGPGGPATVAAWTTDGGQVDARLGATLAPAGDVNGDGFDDVLVGAHVYDNGEIDEGLVLVFLGSPAGLSTLVSWRVEGNQDGALFGRSVSSAGDVNGDGFDDVLIGAEGFDDTHLNEGAAFLYLGSPTGLSTQPAWSATGGQDDASFGVAVAAAGDVNRDGFADILVGAPGFSNGQVREGRAFLYLGSASGAGLTPAWIAESDLAVASFGRALSVAGDVDRDGRSDILVGAPLFGNGQPTEGRTFLYLAPAGGCTGAGCPPRTVASLTVEESAQGTLLRWDAIAEAAAYDVVQGDLEILSGTGGDFTAATSRCLADDWTGLSVEAPDAPTDGGGTWYLVRAINAIGPGSYDGSGNH